MNNLENATPQGCFLRGAVRRAFGAKITDFQRQAQLTGPRREQIAITQHDKAFASLVFGQTQT
jgi:hypothetical protein